MSREPPTPRGPARADRDGGYLRGSSGFRRINFALFAAGVATFLLLYCIQPLLPLLSQEFDVTPARASLTISVTTGALALAIIPLSSLSEARGRVRVMTVAVLAAVVLGCCVPLSPSFGVLLAIRGVQGVALAGLPAVAMAYLAEEVHAASLGLAMGIYIAGNGVGGMLGRLMASLVADIAGWRWGLAAVGIASLACAVVFRAAVPASQRFEPSPLRVRTLARTLRGHLADTGLIRLYAVGLLIMGGFVTVYNYLSYRLLADPFDVSQSIVGLLFIVYVAGTASSMVCGRLVDRYGRRRILWTAATASVVGVLVTLPDSLGLVIVGLAVVTIGFFGAHSTASGWVGRRAGATKAQASSLYLLCYYTGSSLGGWLGGLAYHQDGWSGAAAFAGALLACAVLIAVSLRIPATRP